MTELTSKQLRKAATIKDKIEALETELNRLLGGSGNAVSASPAKSAGPKKRRKMSAATRAKMAAAQQARWAKLKGGKK